MHAETLQELAETARAAEERHDLTAALAAWREAQELLPPGSRQADAISARILRLGGELDRAPAALPGRQALGRRTLWVALGAGALFLLGKGKLLLLGLTKAGTLLSMLAALGVYWTVWGWRFALGLVLSIYVHEMGHVAALSRLGIKASAPTFIPGLGAVVRMKQYPANPVEEARVGLAGPLWGLGAAVVAYVVFLASGAAFWGALARAGAWINLFNLLPLVPLDGGRAFRALSRWQRGAAALALGAMWVATREGLLLLLLVVAVVRVVAKPADPEPSDRRSFFEYLGLTVALALLCVIPLPELAAVSTDPGGER